MSAPKPTQRIGVGSPAILLLNAFGDWVFKAFGSTPYLVGSSAKGKRWRDVDVRLMLPEEEYDALFGKHELLHDYSPRWGLINAAISALAQQQTGLPVDFQIQRQEVASVQHDGEIRVPLCFLTAKGAK